MFQQTVRDFVRNFVFQICPKCDKNYTAEILTWEMFIVCCTTSSFLFLQEANDFSLQELRDHNY